MDAVEKKLDTIIGSVSWILSTSLSGYVWNFCPYFKHGCTARVQLVKAMHSYFKHGCTVHGQQHSDKNYKTANYY